MYITDYDNVTKEQIINESILILSKIITKDIDINFACSKITICLFLSTDYIELDKYSRLYTPIHKADHEFRRLQQNSKKYNKLKLYVEDIALNILPEFWELKGTLH